MKHLKKAAIIGMSVLTAAAVPAALVAINNQANSTTAYTMSATTTKTSTTDPVITTTTTTGKSDEAPVIITSTTDDRQQIDNYDSEQLNSLIWIIAGTGVLLTLLVAIVLLMRKIKKVQEFNKSMEMSREDMGFEF